MLNRILAEARPLLVREATDYSTAYATYDGSNRSTHDGTSDGTRCRSGRDPARLGVRCEREHGAGQYGGCG